MASKPTYPCEDLDLTTLSISSLAHLCRRATDRFFQHASHDDSYCFELFRRAIQEQDELAWDILIEQYTNLVKSWIHRHPYFRQADEDQEYFLNRTFDNFWHAFSRNPDKLDRFNNINSLLQYLKLCTNSAVKEYVDRQMLPRGVFLSETPVETIVNTVDPIASMDDKMFANNVWHYVISTLKNEQERIVAEDYLIYDLKPREIFARHREEFTNVSQVSRVKENLMARLGRDKQLASIFSGSD